MNLKIKICLLIISVLAGASAFSQDFSVSGFVIDTQGNPISFANIVLLSKTDSTAIKGTTSNDKGFFLIEHIDPNSYLLRTSFIGYGEHDKNITIENTSLDVGDIILQESAESLDEISIIAKKPTIKKEADRLVFNVENTALSEGNVLEVVRSTPGVLVLDGSISVKNTTPTVYINDRKVQLSSNELMNLLEGSPANSIKSVEVITNPGAKYDASDGIVINIVMGRNLIAGYRGTIFTNYTQGFYPRYNAGITNFYKNNKINVFASYSYNNDKIGRVSDEQVNFIDNNDAIYERWDSDFDRVTKSQTHTINTNFDYFINDNNTLSFSSNLLFLPKFDYVINGQTNVFDPNYNRLYNFDNVNNSSDDKYNLGFDLDYVSHFNNDSKLSLNVHLTTYDYNRDQKVNSNYYFNDSNLNFSNAFETTSKQNTLINTAQADYSLPISENTGSLSFGAKGSFVNTDSEINQFDIENGNTIFDPNNSNAFDYKESVIGAYAEFEKSWEKFDLSLGLRVEQSNIEGKSLVTNNTLTQDYFNWFPTANVSYQASEKMNFYSNYKRSIERPDYQSLNPFRFYLNDNTIVTGNPNLQPAITDYVEFGISLNSRFFVQTYYKNTDASFMELPLQDNDNNLLIYTPTNLSTTIEYGFDFYTFFDITQKWNVYFVTSVYNIEEEATINNNVLNRDRWSNYTELSNAWSFLKDNSLSANLSLIFMGKNQQGFQVVDGRLFSELSIKKTIFKDRGAITLSAGDLFNKQDFKVTTKYLRQDNSRFLNQDNRFIKLGFSYKFGNTGLETNQRSKDKAERDRLEKSGN
ncbi:glucosamine-6-phosphate deaminase [Hanstruepera neustonica]|uniref:Glucosamine-6-phosphate deaminase n=1 Tax=Hanstruepera neustonica TaxID=1445657 RepID=A0A2K1E3H7_9FLAO|nr:outer membrane beta-barrel family protein [Hanstruepera neustonica]PNQ74832.1 glucosamine-6-phosphate deaminase [Hanstruepera neustonica]